MGLLQAGRDAALRVTPKPLRSRLRDVPLVRRLAGVPYVDVEQADPGVYERSQARWRAARPDEGLTLGTELSGVPWSRKIAEHASPDASTRVLEIGPGYGRLLDGCLQDGLPFGSYVGLDASADNVEHLRGRFDDPRVRFVHGDATSALVEPFDLGMSSLTFKHLYPSFVVVLEHCCASMAPDGRFAFDLIEGSKAFFQPDGVTFIRAYEREEIAELLASIGLRALAFDEVAHAPEHRRLLVVAGR